MAHALTLIIIERPVQDFAILAIKPVLFFQRRENGMFDGKDEIAAGFQHGENLRECHVEIADVMQGERTQHHIETLLRKIDVFDGGAAVFDTGPAIYLGGAVQHVFREINANDMARALLCGKTAMPAETTTEIKKAPVFQGRKHGTQLMPLAGLAQTLHGARHGAVALKKPGIVVDILFHRLLSGRIPSIA
ncbi:hypothetical protein D3C72_1484310 [compost metagenome]